MMVSLVSVILDQVQRGDGGGFCRLCLDGDILRNLLV